MSDDLGLALAAASGDRIATLRALRDRIAKEIESTDSSRDVASLARQLSLVMAEIDELSPPVKKGTPLDELHSRRSARGAGTPRPARPTRSAERG